MVTAMLTSNGQISIPKMLINIFILLFLPITYGCATITRGSTDTLVIETDPPNANATLSNGLQCKTPCSLKLPRNENCIVKIERDGYEPVEVTVTPQTSDAGSAGMAGNILLGGLIGAAVDAGSGAMYDLKPNPVSVKLEKKKESLLQEHPIPVTSPVAIREKTLADRLKELNKLREENLISEDEYQQQKKKVLEGL